MFTQSDLLDLLTHCYLPALQRDVVAAGLLRSAELRPDPEAPGSGIPGVPPRHVAHVTVSAPGSDDAVNAQLRFAVESILLGNPAISRVDLTMLPALFPILNG